MKYINAELHENVCFFLEKYGKLEENKQHENVFNRLDPRMFEDGQWVDPTTPWLIKYFVDRKIEPQEGDLDDQSALRHCYDWMRTRTYANEADFNSYKLRDVHLAIAADQLQAFAEKQGEKCDLDIRECYENDSNVGAGLLEFAVLANAPQSYRYLISKGKKISNIPTVKEFYKPPSKIMFEYLLIRQPFIVDDETLERFFSRGVTHYIITKYVSPQMQLEIPQQRHSFVHAEQIDVCNNLHQTSFIYKSSNIDLLLNQHVDNFYFNLLQRDDSPAFYVHINSDSQLKKLFMPLENVDEQGSPNEIMIYPRFLANLIAGEFGLFEKLSQDSSVAEPWKIMGEITQCPVECFYLLSAIHGEHLDERRFGSNLNFPDIVKYSKLLHPRYQMKLIGPLKHLFGDSIKLPQVEYTEDTVHFSSWKDVLEEPPFVIRSWVRRTFTKKHWYQDWMNDVSGITHHKMCAELSALFPLVCLSSDHERKRKCLVALWSAIKPSVRLPCFFSMVPGQLRDSQNQVQNRFIKLMTDIDKDFITSFQMYSKSPLAYYSSKSLKVFLKLLKFCLVLGLSAGMGYLVYNGIYFGFGSEIILVGLFAVYVVSELIHGIPKLYQSWCDARSVKVKGMTRQHSNAVKFPKRRYFYPGNGPLGSEGKKKRSPSKIEKTKTPFKKTNGK